MTDSMRYRGCLAPPVGHQWQVRTTVADADILLDRRSIELAARNPVAIGRAMFGEDWIVNQGRWGSCNGWAAATALERARVRQGMPRVKLSGTYLYSLINGGRDAGSMLDDGMQAISDRGICRRELVEAGQIYRRSYDTRKADSSARNYRAVECHRCETVEELWSALALGWDCVVVVQAGRNFRTLNQHDVAGVDRGQGNHAVACDGLLWAGGEVVADAYNSWGTSYGHRGRMLLTRRHLEQTIGVHSFYAIRSVTESGDGPPVPRIRRRS